MTYIDDGMKFCPLEEEAIHINRETQDAMKMYGNLRLHKFASNSRKVIEAFDYEDLPTTL